MRLLNHIYARAVLPLFEPESYSRYRGYWVNYTKRERLSIEENRKYQWADLIEMLHHAYRTTEFYRHRFDEVGICPDDIRSPQDLEKIPPLTREDIRQHLPRLCASEYSSAHTVWSATGGTTDVPVSFIRDRACLAKKNAVQAELNSWAGMLPGDKVFYFWGARSDFAQNPSWRWQVYDRKLMRRVWAPTSILNSEVLEGYRESFNSFKPRVVYAYPTPLALFCEYIREIGLPVHRPRAVICTAECVLQEQRAIIQEVLGCPVFEHYGSREFAMIAAECESHKGLHFHPAAAYVELIPLDGESGLHELIVTDLLNRGMPLIRYRSNDCAVLRTSQCPCGRGYPVLTHAISGRVGDNFVLPNGDFIAGVSFTNRLVQACPGLKKTQIIQEELDRFTLRYVPSESFSSSDLVALRERLDQFIPGPVHWDFQPVAEIAREASGKTRHCISKVPKSAYGRAMRRSAVQP